MTRQLTGNLWTLRLEGNLSNILDKHSLGIFTNPFVIISVSSVYADSLWRKGGSVGQAIILPDGQTAYGTNQEIPLNQLFLLEFPLLAGDSYELFYFSLPRLETVNIKVWEYQGETVESLLPELGEYLESSVQLNVDLSEVLTRLDNLNVTVDLSEIQTQLTDIENAIANLDLTSMDISQIITKLDEVRGDIQALNNAIDNLEVTTTENPQVLLRVNGLAQNQTKEIRFWEQPSITTALKVESIYIDAPAEDKVKIEIFTFDNIKLTERLFEKNDTPYAFPDLVLSQGLKVVFSLVGTNPIDKIFIYCVSVPEPVVIDV
jgi:hypothetical protein